MEAGPDLVWSLDAARALVRDAQAWPQFLGNRLALEAQASALDEPTAGALRGAALAWTLPAMVWPEQQRMLSKSPRKRLRADPLPAAADPDGADREPKRPRKDPVGVWVLLTSLFHLARGLFAALHPRTPTPTALTPVAAMTPPDACLTKTPTEDAETFRDRAHALLRDGRVLGAGDVFGGDYTVYKDGDPSTAHSLATARLLPQGRVAVRDLVAFSRVQNQVAKSALLLFPDGADGSPRVLCFNFRAVASR